MRQVFIDKLRAYIAFASPGLLFDLQDKGRLTHYLEDKVDAVLPMAERLLGEGKSLRTVEDLCLDKMTEEFRPSRYLYIREVLEEEFIHDYERMHISGTLVYDTIKLLEVCKQIFDDFEFNNENKDNRYLRHAIIAQVHDFLV